MMSGLVANLHAMLTVRFRHVDGSFRDVEFVIDTGFTGFLTLPPQDVARLGLPFVYHTRAHLADHSEIRLPVHEGTILWTGNELDVNVLATGERPLLGTALLKGHELVVQFADNGLVTIDTL
ncbi:MAG: clan aspartic protease, family [Chthonomonadales bacterium]|nr:clan aspartic protease, family [Chthonomonadales bacterium]